MQNLNQIKSNACKVLALIDLIERSQAKAAEIRKCAYYPIFAPVSEQSEMIGFQNRVTHRLTQYLNRLINP
ncbi:MAG: hypothetical protein EOO20_01690 [Chryseobacterium sp.]|nr:MAG: hypothetical protein EOO20_01690 [Chryseobacterium sp.]